VCIPKAILRWILPISALFGTLLISVVLYCVIAKPPPPFLTTSSPEKTYAVYLTGQKEQPRFFTVEVRFHVLKNGTPFLSNAQRRSTKSHETALKELTVQSIETLQ